jgi:hypothetical protein
MRCTCYLRRGVVYIPTFGRIERGLHVEIEPVAVVPVTDATALHRALKETVARGNPIVPRSTGINPPEAVVLKHARVRSWTAFARGTLVWTFGDRDGVYRITGKRWARPRGWEDDPDQVVTFPPDAGVDALCERLVTILQACATSVTSGETAMTR